MGSLPANGSRLTGLQEAVLRGFFARERGFFLTGGAALAGYHLRHRATDDLDLFTADAEAFARSRHVLGELAVALGATVETRQDAPGFRRVVLHRGDEGLVVDLVLDRGYQCHADNPEIDGVRIDL